MVAQTARLMAAAIMAAAAISGSGPAAMADAAAGKALVKAKCQVCHGVDGIAKIPIAPHLAGESQIYLETQLKAFRTGKRVNEMMSVVAKDLSDEDIRNISAWYSSMKITVTMPE